MQWNNTIYDLLYIMWVIKIKLFTMYTYIIYIHQLYVCSPFHFHFQFYGHFFINFHSFEVLGFVNFFSLFAVANIIVTVWDVKNEKEGEKILPPLELVITMKVHFSKLKLTYMRKRFLFPLLLLFLCVCVSVYDCLGKFRIIWQPILSFQFICMHVDIDEDM